MKQDAITKLEIIATDLTGAIQEIYTQLEENKEHLKMFETIDNDKKEIYVSSLSKMNTELEDLQTKHKESLENIDKTIEALKGDNEDLIEGILLMGSITNFFKLEK